MTPVVGSLVGSKVPKTKIGSAARKGTWGFGGSRRETAVDEPPTGETSHTNVAPEEIAPKRILDEFDHIDLKFRSGDGKCSLPIQSIPD